jgi:hypothetical protein
MPISHNWLVRGAQSAFFYYVSCEPCSASKAQRRRKKQAEMTRKRKEENALQQPDLYNHPAPFEINQYWQEDIDIGPQPPLKRPRKATQESKRPASVTSNRTAGSHQVQAPREAYLPDGSVSKKRYRRADEEIQWTEEVEEDESTKEGGWKFRSWSAPPVNDLHPAVVSVVPPKAEDRRWMKLPPPSTDYLNGRKGIITLRRPSIQKKSFDSTRRVTRHSSRLTAAEIEERDFELGPVSPNSMEGFGVSISRPDSGISTRAVKSKIRHHRRRGNTWESTSASSSDADDEDDDDYNLPARPRAVYRTDGVISRADSKRSAPRPVLPTLISQDYPQSRTSTPGALRDRSNSANASPRTSPQSHASAGSPISSENVSPIPSPRMAAQRHSLYVVLPGRSNSSSAVPEPESTMTITTNKIKRPEPRRADSSQDHKLLIRQLAGLGLQSADEMSPSPINLSRVGTYDRSYDDPTTRPDLEEQLAREQIWLGARERLMTPSKRWSTDF